MLIAKKKQKFDESVRLFNNVIVNNVLNVIKNKISFFPTNEILFFCSHAKWSAKYELKKSTLRSSEIAQPTNPLR